MGTESLWWKSCILPEPRLGRQQRHRVVPVRPIVVPPAQSKRREGYVLPAVTYC